jgi:hypothetical protein
MADGALNLKLDEEFARRIAAAADSAGVSKESLAAQLIEQHLFRYEDYSWIGDDPHSTPVADDDYAGEVFELETVLGEFGAELDRRLARRR